MELPICSPTGSVLMESPRAQIGAIGAAAGRAAREDGGRLFVVALSPCARRIIGLTGLQAVLGERDVRDKHAA